ncbi:hypothetical protein Nepgr_012404 [Nepenthes gracilis]|uniref:Uncharacterized protein n=1 Tax=Nepenthes gracilis TaxID=150966 RepID=A0AAD3SFY1_NEPGR|nr:hypothetical protein Nepgr_012404 [Nepenthes gracilis]
MIYSPYHRPCRGSSKKCATHLAPYFGMVGLARAKHGLFPLNSSKLRAFYIQNTEFSINPAGRDFPERPGRDCDD